jgi:hypothetical protein
MNIIKMFFTLFIILIQTTIVMFKVVQNLFIMFIFSQLKKELVIKNHFFEMFILRYLIKIFIDIVILLL